MSLSFFYLTSSFIFSRMAAKVKQQTAPCPQAVTEQDLIAMEKEFNLSYAKESIFEQLRVNVSKNKRKITKSRTLLKKSFRLIFCLQVAIGTT